MELHLFLGEVSTGEQQSSIIHHDLDDDHHHDHHDHRYPRLHHENYQDEIESPISISTELSLLLTNVLEHHQQCRRVFHLAMDSSTMLLFSLIFGVCLHIFLPHLERICLHLHSASGCRDPVDWGKVWKESPVRSSYDLPMIAYQDLFDINSSSNLLMGLVRSFSILDLRKTTQSIPQSAPFHLDARVSTKGARSSSSRGCCL